MSFDPGVKRKLGGVGVLCAAALVLVALLFRGYAGFLGGLIGDALENHFGLSSVFIPLVMAFTGAWLLRGEPVAGYWRNLAGYAVIYISVLAVLGAVERHYAGNSPDASRWSGDLGAWTGMTGVSLIGFPGLILASIFLVAVGAFLVRHDPFFGSAWRAVMIAARFTALAYQAASTALGRLFSRRSLASRTRLVMNAPVTVVTAPSARGSNVTASGQTAVREAPSGVSADEAGTSADGEEEQDDALRGGKGVTERKSPRRHRRGPGAPRWELPSPDFLAKDSGGADPEMLRGMIDKQVAVIDQTLAEFKVEGRVVGVTPGTRVILYEWQPAPGVKANRIEQLADDLSLRLKAERLRVVLPMPGKGTVGIEIPHPSPGGVTLGSLLATCPDPRMAGDLPLFLGRFLTGEPLIADLVQMPHLLVAGTTGSGKSVCIHSILLSLMMTRTPDQLRLLLIDPKRVEMIAYVGSPHLLHDVITDAKRAVAALRWMVQVMEARYRLLAHFGCRDLAAFNKSMADGDVDLGGEETGAGTVLSPTGLPWIMVAVDELADLMVTKPREVEDALQRLAQMARGVGIHLVVATQRPSVDVLTGVIKANMPSRISFQVATQVDSRTILDSGGAEQLLGKGDMLYSPTGSPSPSRAQGAFVAPAEVEKVLDHWREQGETMPVLEAEKTEVPVLTEESGSNDDELYEEAVALVTRTGEASVSMLQRRLAIGFARAGRLVDMMESRGVVGPKQGSKTREILTDRSSAQSDGGGDAER
jgi:S-DNA-T family DNA segregation ATPase FtsK/SpoIIIE